MRFSDQRCLRRPIEMSQPVARDQSPRGELRRKRKAGEQRLPGKIGALEEQHRRRTRSDPNRQQTDQRIRKPRQTERHVIGGGFKNAATPWGQARRDAGLEQSERRRSHRTGKRPAPARPLPNRDRQIRRKGVGIPLDLHVRQRERFEQAGPIQPCEAGT